MADIDIIVENLPELQRNLRNAPKISTKWLQKATQASVFVIKKHAVDENFLFKTPRAQRTGYLQISFNYGVKISLLRAAIGPTADYAPYVYYGTSRGIVANPYMERIARAANPEVQKLFSQAIEAITKEIANV